MKKKSKTSVYRKTTPDEKKLFGKELSNKIDEGVWLNNEELKIVRQSSPPEPDYEKMWLQLTFIENEKFRPVRELIDKKFKKFFKKLISLSPLKEELEKYKNELYNIIYQRIINDTFLMKGIDFINDAKTKIGEGDDSIVQELIISGGLAHFTAIIDEVFEIPNLVLSAFEISTKNFKKELNKYGGLDVSDPNEQELFDEVWKINEKNSTENIKFSPYATFIGINDRKKYVKDELILPNKFSSTPLYNRYKQFRKKKQKENKNSIRLPK